MKKLIPMVLILVFVLTFSACAYDDTSSDPFNLVGQLVYKSEVINRACNVDGEVLKVVIVIIRTNKDSFFVMESNDGYHSGGRFNFASVNKSEQNYEVISKLELNKNYCFFTKEASPFGKYRKIVSFQTVE